MPVYGSSSRQFQLVNPDGSFNVYCWNCNQFLAKTYMRVGRALCEMCRRAMQDEPVNAAAEEAYRLSKAEHVDVSLLMVPDDSRANKKFSLRTMGGELLQAVGLKKQKKEQPESKKLADQKRRGRLFENVVLGDMNDLDKKAR